MQTKVKICGITSTEDALLAEELGADYVGLIFADGSPRQVTVERARNIISALTNAKPVGVFVEQNQAQIQALASEIGLWGAQHYTRFDSEFDGVVSIYAHRVQSEVSTEIGSADYMLLDAFSEDAYGGTGHSFDWSLIPQEKDKVFLAGGINPNNVQEALEQNTFAIDLASGVESAPGIKDMNKMKSLFERIEESRNG